MSFCPPTDLPFPIYALFRLEPYVGRFPESPHAKEQVVKGHYGRRAKPGERCSLRHLMTRMYLGKREREKEDAGRACLLKESRGWEREERLPDMLLTVVSGEAWKDEGIAVLWQFRPTCITTIWTFLGLRCLLRRFSAFLPRLMCRFSYIPS